MVTTKIPPFSPNLKTFYLINLFNINLCLKFTRFNLFNHHREVADGRKGERSIEENSKEKVESKMKREGITFKRSIKGIFEIKSFHEKL